MKTAFSLALVSIVESSLALRLAATAMDTQFTECTTVNDGEMRVSVSTSQAFAYQWSEGIKNFTNTEEIIFGDLTMRYCDDQTIRNVSNQCLTRVESELNHNIIAPCEADNLNQQFSSNSKTQTNDNLSFGQTVISLLNAGSNACIDAQGASNDVTCSVETMFRHKGAAVDSGSLQNVGTKMCLEPVEIDSETQVTSAECSDDTNQNFTMYQNKEIVHDNSGMCLGNMKGQTNGIVVLYYCEDSLLQGWNSEQIDDAYYFSSMFDDLYLDSDAQGDFISKSQFAEGERLQQWRVISAEEWAIPQFQWISVGCDSGVDTTHMYTQSMYMENSTEQQTDISDETVESFKNALLVMTTMENGNNPIVDPQAVPEVYNTLSELMWHPSDAYVDKQHAFNCGEFEDGTLASTGGCLWRSLMTAHNYYENEDLYWHTPLTKCTTSAEPQCPPYTHCIDSGCSECVLSGYVTPQ